MPSAYLWGIKQAFDTNASTPIGLRVSQSLPATAILPLDELGLLALDFVVRIPISLRSFRRDESDGRRSRAANAAAQPELCWIERA